MTDPRVAVIAPAEAAASAATVAPDDAHRQMLHWLDRLDEVVTHLEATDWDGWSRDQARSVIDFFSRTARQHHVDEEVDLFPGLAGRGDAAMDRHIDRLLQDHGWLEENWLELMAQLRPVAEGFGGFDLDMLRHAATVFGALLREHIELEESTIYPAARRARAASLRAEAPSSS